MNHDIQVLVLAAISIGFFHTLMGPDHYLPFIAMSQSGKWSMRKTSLITILCGLGHVLSSVLLGLAGVALGTFVSKLEIFDGIRGDMAAWALTALGLAYMVWGIRRAIKNKPHSHFHAHNGGEIHEHTHGHHQDHAHVHATKKKHITPWALFIIFVLGPCEPLIPILMYPAAKSSIMGMVLVATVFAITTIATMLAVVLIASYGISFLPLKKFERYSHALAGFTIMACGVAIHMGL